jgi:site-specific DNA recombinase
MQRTALYARVSTDLQEKEQTIQSQLAAVTRYADQQGFRHTPALTYKDDGYSGTWLDRPALDELRDHAREGRFDVVVVLCPDRLARRYAYQVLLLEELKRAGIEVHFCERPINDTPDDQLLLQIQGAIAEYERAKLLERCRRGRLHRARQGELAPPHTPYGYSYAARKYGGDGQIRIDEEEAAMVRQAFAWYAEEGSSLLGLVKKLNASPWKTRRGKKEWNSTTVRAILQCEWYVGRAYYNRVKYRAQERTREEIAQGAPRKIVRTERPRSEWITVPVPRILDDELFERVQQRIQENRHFAERRLKRKRTYLLRGLLKCGMCGYAYLGMTQPTRSPDRAGFRYYRCSARYEAERVLNGITERCTNQTLRGDGVDEVVWITVRDLLLHSDVLVGYLQDWLERTSSDITCDERLQLATSRLSELNRQRERLIDAYQTGALELDDFRTRKTTIEERIVTVEHEQAQLGSRATRRELAVRQVAGAEAFVEQLRHQLDDPSFEIKRAILRLVVEKVVVTGHRLEINLALPVSGDYDLTSRWRPKTPIYQNSAFCLTTREPRASEVPRIDAVDGSPLSRRVSSEELSRPYRPLKLS